MNHWQNILFFFTLLARISDLLTTWLVSPTLKLEANPLARKFRWPFAFLTLLVAFLAYYTPEMAVAIATASFLVAGSNASRIAAARALGEEQLFAMVLAHARTGKFWPGLLARIAPVPFYGLLAGFVFWFYPTPTSWGWFIALGIASYAAALLVHYTLSYIRFRRMGGLVEISSKPPVQSVG